MRYRDYKHVIQLSGISDIIVSIVYLLCQPVMLVTERSLMFISNGFIGLIWPGLDLWLMALLSAGVHLNVVFLPVPFLYRYFNLCRGHQPSLTLLSKLCIVPALQAVYGMFISYNFMNAGPEYQRWALAHLNQTGWPNDIGQRMAPFLSGGNFADLACIVQVGMFTLAGIIVVSVIVFCEYAVLKKLRVATSMMRESTRRMHAELNKALIALAFAPLVLSCIPIVFFVTTIVIGANPGPITVMLASQMSWIAIANPITTTFFVRPYRRAVLQWLRISVSKTDVSLTSGMRSKVEPKSCGQRSLWTTQDHQ
ncbi:7TM GPCR protein [Aphelenchoides avenae]|nr:7TM GPCR protein [Aphelenchus avenae]